MSLPHVSNVEAATILPIRDAAYSAKYVSQSIPDPVVMEAGAKTTVTFTFKNTGTATWQSSGKRFLSAYTREPKARKSVFQGANWKSGEQTAAIAKATKPGETATLAIDLVAPAKVGDYTEHFHLSSEDYTWVKGGGFYIKLKVVPATVKPVASVPTPPPVVLPTRASVSMQNFRPIAAAGGEQVGIVLAFENRGQSTWRDYSVVASAPSALAMAGVPLSFADDTWRSTTVALHKEQEVRPAQLVLDSLSFRAPAKAGVYTLTFHLRVDGTLREEATVQIPVTVTSDAPDHYALPLLPEGEPAPTYRFAEEPRIRVGLWQPEGAVKFASADDDFRVLAGATEMGILPKQATAELSRKNGVYAFAADGLVFETPDYIRLEPVNNPDAVFTLLNYERFVSWKGPRNFNTYRGAMEYRLTQKGTLYVINDLPIEDYVAGIGETSNVSPIEYIKTMLTAARTYAYFIKEYSGKHDERHFDVVAHTGDQLYLGYESEVLMPRVVEAARATRGYMVTFNNEIVITPYYANSDGRTRAWTEVWGGAPKPWLQSVAAEYDRRDGKNLYGHGVGISARDAAVRAEEQGLDFVALLKYYYTGVEVTKMYK